jgi:hypothetical protein
MYFIVYLFVTCQASQDDEFIYSVHFLDIYRMLLNQAYCNKIPRATQCGLLSGHQYCLLTYQQLQFTCNSMYVN